jgi:hypothetical protein
MESFLDVLDPKNIKEAGTICFKVKIPRKKKTKNCNGNIPTKKWMEEVI